MSYKLTLYIQNKSTSPKQTGFLINQAGLWEYNNKCTHSELHCQNRTGSVGFIFSSGSTADPELEGRSLSEAMMATK